MYSHKRQFRQSNIEEIVLEKLTQFVENICIFETLIVWKYRFSVFAIFFWNQLLSEYNNNNNFF